MMIWFRRIATVVAFVSVSLVSYGDISVNMQDANGVFLDAGLTTLVPAGAYVQLVWSADNSYSGFGGSITPYFSEAVADDYSAYGDYVLWSGGGNVAGGFSIDLDGSASYADAAVGGADINTGYLFIYIFQDATPSGTDYFGRSAIYDTSTFSDSSTLPTPPADNVFVAELAPLAIDTYQLQVPEPSSMALMGIGLAVAGFVRRRRKNS